MSKKTALPKCCTVCGGDNLQPVERHAMGNTEADKKNISGLLGFCCGKGHTFLIDESDLTKNPRKSAQQDLKG
jgi:hypothetical protein